jgi:Dual OB-containing domain
MAYSKEIICLANARRPGGRCVAGKEVLRAALGGWIRPVSARATSEVSAEERQYEPGAEPAILDIMGIPLRAPAPNNPQTENHIIDDHHHWRKLGQFAWEKLPALSDSPSSLWANGSSSFHGLNDRMPGWLASDFHNSLHLIRPDDVVIRVLTSGADFGNDRRRVRAQFVYRDTKYDFIVTDPASEELFLARPNGEDTIGASYFCVSVTLEHTDGYSYKLVATIIPERT